jgi:hypothetical protein
LYYNVVTTDELHDAEYSPAVNGYSIGKDGRCFYSILRLKDGFPKVPPFAPSSVHIGVYILTPCSWAAYFNFIPLIYLPYSSRTFFC